MGKKYDTVLTVAGSDTIAGAGIQADLKTFSAIGCYGVSVITALTAQNTKGVTGIHPVPLDFIEKQFEAIASDINIETVKLGMLYSKDIVDLIAQKIIKYKIKKVVLDPVMVAQSGDSLFLDNLNTAIIEKLLPLATIVTPNLYEASVLLNEKINDISDMEVAAKKLAKYGSTSVLIKGGHLINSENKCLDVLYISQTDQTIILSEEKISTNNNHGTGCTLASAIASYLEKGFSIVESVKKGKKFITHALKAGESYSLGAGAGPVHHFFNFWT
ncbi:MAG: bifunctional hydroxymethylpyrimidine kinase/phosphomethylpyrimidine kinase [Desulfobacterales bacterium]|nr:bifunctional hydroxymethylpyrimidine kinase/phosphomethylpyrimidine kinase [Desulfobacterales bacterium]MBF0395405.1 bifunctional hydroxymethylpyrimidine kinase/phosphomethylpyrimidine kinase [Desulfobacterales bacterium]